MCQYTTIEHERRTDVVETVCRMANGYGHDCELYDQMDERVELRFLIRAGWSVDDIAGALIELGQALKNRRRT